MLIRRQGEPGWREPAISSWQDEDALQQVIEAAPELLPGFVGRRLVAAREVGTAYGPADLLVLDEEGSIAIVECKLERNAEIKRKVVGQLLEYAASVWRSSYEEFEAAFANAAKQGLEDSVAAIAGASDWEPERFRAAVEENLAAGRFHLVFAVDAITPELKDIVEYLNTTGGDDLSVLALELRYVRDGDVELLVPIVYGSEMVRRKAKKRQRWGLDQLFGALTEKRSPEVSNLCRDLASWSEGLGAELVTGVGKSPTLNAWFPSGESKVRLWYLGSDGTLRIIWKEIRRGMGLERAERFLDSLRAISGMDETLRGAETKSDTGVPLDLLLSSPEAFTSLKKAVEELVEPA